MFCKHIAEIESRVPVEYVLCQVVMFLLSIFQTGLLWLQTDTGIQTEFFSVDTETYLSIMAQSGVFSILAKC